ncbi:hypothetical protein, partial [Tunturiibacter gelidoferens]|uniref:hypothetical protein n=1 Tax=Tunturiibacter gelidiferens TaxID=3069689 RepID=UPI001C855D1F
IAGLLVSRASSASITGSLTHPAGDRPSHPICLRQPKVTPGKGRRTLADLRVAILFSECIADLLRVGVTVQRPGNGNPARDNIN